MNAIAKTSQMTQDFDELKIRLKTTWMGGDYDVFSRFLEKDADRFYRRLNVKPGTRRGLRVGSVEGSPCGSCCTYRSRARQIFDVALVASGVDLHFLGLPTSRLFGLLPSANDPTNLR